MPPWWRYTKRFTYAQTVQMLRSRWQLLWNSHLSCSSWLRIFLLSMFAQLKATWDRYHMIMRFKLKQTNTEGQYVGKVFFSFEGFYVIDHMRILQSVTDVVTDQAWKLHRGTDVVIEHIKVSRKVSRSRAFPFHDWYAHDLKHPLCWKILVHCYHN